MTEATYNKAIELMAKFEATGFFELPARRNWEAWKEWDVKYKSVIEDMGCQIFAGCSKTCLVFKDFPYVIKFDTLETNNDCAIEYENYLEAEKAGLAHYFAKTELLCKKHGRTFTLQQKVSMNGEIHSLLYEVIDAQTDEYGFAKEADREYSIEADIADMEDEERIYSLLGHSLGVMKLIQFIRERGIDDLHEENWGLFEDYPIITDFSGCN